MSENKGVVFNVQKMSIHDGPGIRTTVFLKGCPLDCLWCSNPESQRATVEIALLTTKCIKCGYCAEVCPKGIIGKEFPFPILDRDACDVCGICAKECCTMAKDVIGKEYDDAELLKEIESEKPFYESSGGGVTFSGGEPFVQFEFLNRMLQICQESGIHTAIETTGYTDKDKLLEAAKHLDLVFMDVKHMDSAKHKELTRVGNEKILENLKALSEVHDNIIVRIPVIPDINDQMENLKATADYVASLGIGTLELLPYHNLGKNKYDEIGRVYQLTDVKTPSRDRMEDIAAELRNTIGDRVTQVQIMKSINE